MPAPPRTARETIALAAERIRAAARAQDPDDKATTAGSTVPEWAAAAKVDELVVDTHLDATDVATLACQSLSRSGLIERVSGVPVRYRRVLTP